MTESELGSMMAGGGCFKWRTKTLMGLRWIDFELVNRSRSFSIFFFESSLIFSNFFPLFSQYFN